MAIDRFRHWNAWNAAATFDLVGNQDERSSVYDSYEEENFRRICGVWDSYAAENLRSFVEDANVLGIVRRFRVDSGDIEEFIYNSMPQANGNFHRPYSQMLENRAQLFKEFSDRLFNLSLRRKTRSVHGRDVRRKSPHLLNSGRASDLS